jgi:hypothetical protein
MTRAESNSGRRRVGVEWTGVCRLDLARRRGVLCWCWDPGWTRSTQPDAGRGRPGAGDLPRSDEVRAASAVTEECAAAVQGHACCTARTCKADRARRVSAVACRLDLVCLCSDQQRRRRPGFLFVNVKMPVFSYPILPKFHYAKRRFTVTSKCRQMHGVLNVDEIKN